MSQQAGRCLAGAIAGLMATLPMTAVMIAGKRHLPRRSQDPLPPVQITQNALRAVDLDDELSREEELALTAVNHFAFGASAGALYGPLCRANSAVDAMTSGCIYGLGVWTTSYLGWLPVTGLYRSVVDETPERNALMIVAHLVWGASLGLAAHVIADGHRGQSQDRTPRLR